MKSTMLFLFIIILTLGLFSAPSFGTEELQVGIQNLNSNNQDVKVNFQKIDQNKIMVSVLNSEDDPVKGLKPENFIITKEFKQAKIISTEVLETQKDIGMNIVLVIDNSYSMIERKAVKPLLSALDEFLKIVRPIDNVEVVVFDKKKILKIKDHTLHINTFKSSDHAELKNFFSNSFENGWTYRTFLHEGIVGGLHLISQMPEKSNKFLVVFSDGEDMNSNIKEKVVAAKAKSLKNFSAYTVDFMPSDTTDAFLKAFSKSTGGKTWKADSAENLLPVFKQVSTTLLHQYVVEYQFANPPEGSMTLNAKQLNFDILTTLDGEPMPYYLFFETGKSDLHPKYHRFSDNNEIDNFDENNFQTTFDKYYSILNLTGKHLTQNLNAKIRIIGCNSNQNVEKNNLTLSKNRALSVMSYLNSIWKIDKSRMEILARDLPKIPAVGDMPGSRSENQRVEIVFEPAELQAALKNDFKVEQNNIHNLTILPRIKSEYGLSRWELFIESKNKVIETITGNSTLAAEYSIDLDKMSVQTLSNLEYIEADIRVEDIYKDSFTTDTQKCLITVVNTPAIHGFVLPPKGSISVNPESVTIEEVTVIDSSPLLNYIFFNTGDSKIPKYYNLLKNQAEAGSFDETKLKDAISKYYNLLNIMGKRLLENSDAKITLTGCISNQGIEKDKIALSRARAREVQVYLQYIWGIDPDRIELTARKLPSHPSTSYLKEGRMENQRVEISSDSPKIIDSIKSTYTFDASDYDELKIKPKIEIGYDLKAWKIDIYGDDELLESMTGKDNNIPEYSFNLVDYGLKKIGKFDHIAVKASMTDKKDNLFTTQPTKTSIKYLKRIEREAKKQEYKVVEKYALILFDYNSSEVKSHNKIILDRVITRIKDLPGAKVIIVGHTDILGKKAYNVSLSLRRAKSVYKMVKQNNIPSPERVIFRGDGPDNPPFDNTSPEGRSFNRTVTIVLEYDVK